MRTLDMSSTLLTDFLSVQYNIVIYKHNVVQSLELIYFL